MKVRGLFLTLALLPSVPAIAQQVNLWNSPRWTEQAIFYQVFPERFCNGDPKNDPTRESLEQPVRPGPDWHISRWTADWYARDDWEKALGDDFYKDGVFDRRYGGDLQGVISKLGYLQDLGVNAIYFNPLFYSRSLHKYDGNSYHHIDPYFGPDPVGDLKLIARETADPASWQWTAADNLFLDLLKQCHARGMKVIIDGVFNHTGRDFFAFKDIRRNQRNSPYKDWYVIDSFDDPNTKRNEFSYKGWWGTKTLPVFAPSRDGRDMYAAPKAYIFEATKRWMQPNGKPEDGIDGWRLDVADERPPKFWADWNAWVRRLNPNAYTTAEIWTNAANFIRQGGFSACMNYNAFTIPAKAFLVDDKIPPSRMVTLMDSRRNDFPAKTAAIMQNLLDSHDTDRVASMIVNRETASYEKVDNTEFNRNNNARSSDTYEIRRPNENERDIQRLVVLFQMCYVGAPMIYYGDEAGMWGGNDPDDRMPMVWQDVSYDAQALDPRGRERTPDAVSFEPELYKFYKAAVHLRREHDALNYGDFSIIAADDDQHCLAFSRRSEKETVVVAINRSGEQATLKLQLHASALQPLLVTKGELTDVQATSREAGTNLILPPLTGIAFSYSAH